jgi:4-hydroxybenzoate polyprenyltransferase
MSVAEALDGGAGAPPLPPAAGAGGGDGPTAPGPFDLVFLAEATSTGVRIAIEVAGTLVDTEIDREVARRWSRALDAASGSAFERTQGKGS